LSFQVRLPITQFSCIAFDFRQDATKVGRFLSGHATVFIEIERFISHQVYSHRFAAYPAID
jgi:hypothetical protein